jgi:hypothetical protein
MPILPAKTGEALLTKSILYSGKRCLAVCYRKCNKTWGFNGDRPQWRDPLTMLSGLSGSPIGRLASRQPTPAPTKVAQGKPSTPPRVHRSI